MSRLFPAGESEHTRGEKMKLNYSCMMKVEGSREIGDKPQKLKSEKESETTAESDGGCREDGLKTFVSAAGLV